MERTDYEGEFDSHESREIELAAELLGVSDEPALDEFFGKLLRGRSRGRRRSPARRKLKDLLRKSTRSVLALGGQMPDDQGDPDFDARQMFGIETEGLSPEDRDLEIARRVVRLAGDAARRLGDAPSGEAAQAARRALLDSAQLHAPGLASQMRRGTIVLPGACPSTSNRKEGEALMHDLDRTLRSQESENYDFEADLFGESESDYEDPSYEISEEDELDLAAELLAVSDENELDEFFRKLFNRAKGAVGSALKKYVKPLAKKVIPFAGRALGGFIGGPAGAAIGGKLGSYASTLFEVDFESMDGETQDLEKARHFVRFARAAGSNAAASGGTGNPAAVARAAVVNAAKAHAPGLIRPRGPRIGSSTAANKGVWIRRGDSIVLRGV